jgi:hypothetical protein
LSQLCSCLRVRTPQTSMPSTRLGSAKLSTGTTAAGHVAFVGSARRAAPRALAEPASHSLGFGLILANVVYGSAARPAVLPGLMCCGTCTTNTGTAPKVLV